MLAKKLEPKVLVECDCGEIILYATLKKADGATCLKCGKTMKIIKPLNVDAFC